MEGETTALLLRHLTLILHCIEPTHHPSARFLLFVTQQATVRFYSACVKSAVVFLHEEGFIHRNVTPHCVYITDAGYCQLADLTCAKKMDGNKVIRHLGWS